MINQQRPPSPPSYTMQIPESRWPDLRWIEGTDNPTVIRRCKVYRRQVRRWARHLGLMDQWWDMHFELVLDEFPTSAVVVCEPPSTATFKINHEDILHLGDQQIELLAVREVARLFLGEKTGDDLPECVATLMIQARNGAWLARDSSPQ
jgi:hypothetical protein